MYRVRFDMKFLATRRTRQLEQTDVISIESAVRFLLRYFLSDTSSVAVNEIGTNTYRVTFTFDSVSVNLVSNAVGIVADPTFAASLSNRIERLVSIVSPVITIVEAVSAPLPPPPPCIRRLFWIYCSHK